MQSATGVQTIVDKPLFDPTYLNIEYIFNKIASSIQPTINLLTNPSTWGTIGTISAIVSIIFLSIIIFSLVRMYEIQVFDKKEIEHEISHALAKTKEKERELNPRWKYILTLLESPNESDWRVAIIESDTLLEEAFRERCLVGNTMSELLEEAKMNGYSSIQSAWDAHLVRNKIAHEGLNYPVTQVEVRRVIKLYQNVFEDLQVI